MSQVLRVQTVDAVSCQNHAQKRENLINTAKISYMYLLGSIRKIIIKFKLWLLHNSTCSISQELITRVRVKHCHVQLLVLLLFCFFVGYFVPVPFAPFQVAILAKSSPFMANQSRVGV